MRLTPSKARVRYWPLAVFSGMLAVSIVVGIAVAAYLVIRFVLHVLSAGMAVGTMGLVMMGAYEFPNQLANGDSEMRLELLRQLKQQFDTQPALSMDSQAAEWLLPAIEQCKIDGNPEVVWLADDVAAYISERTLPGPN